MNAIVFGSGVACAAVLLLSILKSPSDLQIYVAALFSTLGLVLLIIVFLTLSMYHSNLLYNIVMWVIFAVSFGIVLIMDEVFLVSCLAKTVSSRIQTIAESIRLSMNRLAALLALLTASFLFEWIKVVACFYIIVCIITLTLFVLRRKVLMHPTIKIY